MLLFIETFFELPLNLKQSTGADNKMISNSVQGHCPHGVLVGVQAEISCISEVHRASELIKGKLTLSVNLGRCPRRNMLAHMIENYF